MTTTANITFFKQEVAVSSDGYPEDTIPYLEELRQKVLDFAKKHNLNHREASLIILDREMIEREMNLNWKHYDNPRYEYEVDEDGVRVTKGENEE